MGSSGSKAYISGGGESSSSISSGGWKGKCKRNRVFQSSCFGGSSGSHRINDNHHVCDPLSKENGGNASLNSQTEMEPDQVKYDCYRKVKVEASDATCVSSSVELDEWGGASITNTASRTGSSSARALATPSLNSQSSFPSHFGFLPGNVSFRLNRAASLGSSKAYRIPFASLQMLNDEETHLQARSSNNFIDGNEISQAKFTLPTSPTQNHGDTSASLQHHNGASDFLGNSRGYQTISSTSSGTINGNGTKMEIDGTSKSPRINSESDGFETRIPDRRNGALETVEHNVCFSRTLSVGRLRDRVLRRSSLSDAAFYPGQQERQVRDAVQGIGAQSVNGEMRISESEHAGLHAPTASGYPGTSSSLFNDHDHELENTRSRETRYHDLLEHRSNFLERRRRIQSQVRALQRLGNRFENLSGHERSCILSDHHRAGRCTCRVTNRDANLNDDTTAIAGISRIVMLEEALFEVLDEIHQQSAVLSSQPSMSALGSVPAPNEVVDSLPVRLYTKSLKYQNDEMVQCYICLVEYEEGDSLRVLPCHHEFHRTCIDKWLKEIHRVCPLCRGDICRSDSLPTQN